MPIQVKEENGGKIVVIELTGRLVKADYGSFAAEFEQLLQRNGKLRVLVDMKNFHGWDVRGVWEEIKFDVKHRADLERLAMVGDSAWEHGMAALCRPFTKASIRYFDQTEAASARKWLAEA